jgi:hypothetical protein
MINLINNGTMKNFNKFFAMAAIVTFASACVSDDDYGVPETAPGQAVSVPGNLVDLITVTNRLLQSGDPTLKFEDTNQYVAGFVISDDIGGNWFKEIIIQDKTVNPTIGINIQIDVNPLFTTYEFGRRVYVKLDGLTVGTKNGVYTLGIGDNMDRIQESRRDEFITRDNVVETITPRAIEFSDFSNALENTWVQLSNVQFTTEDLGKTFAAEPTDQFDGERKIKSCNDSFGADANLWTSSFSDFKAITVPSGRGTVNAILTRDFFNAAYVLYVNTPNDFSFDDPNRCDLTPILCGVVGGPGANTLLFENFETQSTGASAMPAGWVNFQEAGSQTWKVYTATGTNASLGKSVNIGSFRSGDASTVAWLITPRFDFSAQTGEVISFETSNSFADGSTMQVLFSNDWDGTPTGVASATWQPLGDAIIVQDTENFGNWVFSRNVSLDCVTGTGAIAFRYEGSGDAATDGTYELDNIRLTSN